MTFLFYSFIFVPTYHESLAARTRAPCIETETRGRGAEVSGVKSRLQACLMRFDPRIDRSPFIRSSCKLTCLPGCDIVPANVSRCNRPLPAEKTGTGIEKTGETEREIEANVVFVARQTHITNGKGNGAPISLLPPLSGVVYSRAEKVDAKLTELEFRAADDARITNEDVAETGLR